jgi:hypothetical protein
MPDDDFAHSSPKTVGLCRLIEEFQLEVPLPATRSEIVRGARKTIAADGKITPPKGNSAISASPCAMSPLLWMYI